MPRPGETHCITAVTGEQCTAFIQGRHPFLRILILMSSVGHLKYESNFKAKRELWLITFESYSWKVIAFAFIFHIRFCGNRRVIEVTFSCNCPACRTSLIATRFWVVMICPIIKCLTVLEFSFILLDFVFIHHNFQFHFELCTYWNVLDIYLSQNLNFVNYLLFYMKLLNYLFFNVFGSVLECGELTGVSLLWPWLIK